METFNIQAYELVEDCCRKLHKEADDIFLQGIVANHIDDCETPDALALYLVGRWTVTGNIPKWLYNWLLDVMIGRAVWK